MNTKTDTRGKFPAFVTRSELKRLIHTATQKFPACRIGQAVCNNWSIHPKLEEKIYGLNGFETVTQEISNFYWGN